ncbi:MULTISPECIES: GAF domain-containing sensor histidine kinase [unclassified Roseivivax]|uniref:GAF domain-containing sensor histidine kinase n=1 Tax=unclassified Roseivivax TaxID=2639302 RepID=UPI0012692215|nr:MULTISPECIES: GAF domain-containing sensor histidine kinase [unclassified Roseivivax]QFS81379.1 Histidine protein kinase DivJ [Roseivivax sp. THAF197b]
MRNYPIPFNEQERLAALRAVPGLTPENDAMFDAICDATRKLFDCPLAHISVLDEEEQWYKSVVGMDLPTMPKTQGFCAFAIMSDEVMVVPDMTLDPRFKAHPMVVPGSPGARFYAGVPLVLSNGYRFGSLCAIDLKPHEMPSEQQLDTLRALGQAVVAALEAAPLDKASDAPDLSQAGFFNLISHELRTPLTVALGSMRMLQSRLETPLEARLADAAIRASENLAKLIDSVITFSDAQTGELRLNDEVVDLRSLLEDVVAVHVPTAEGADRSMTLGTLGFDGALSADADQIKLALAALSLNAIVHGGSDMVLETALDAEGNLEIIVRDNGTMSGDVDLAELYKPFVVGTAIDNRDARGGLGLGLPLTRKLVELHGGDFMIDADAEHTVARIRLPHWRIDAAQTPKVIAAE